MSSTFLYRFKEETNIKLVDDNLVYFGYPDGNLLMVFFEVLQIWSEHKVFPIKYFNLPPFQVLS